MSCSASSQGHQLCSRIKYVFLQNLILESLEFYYKYLMSQDNKEWEPVIGEYRDVLVVLRTTLLGMQRR